MLGCCSIVSCCMLSSIVLLIIALCHSCLAICKLCIRFRRSLYRFQPKSSHLSSGILGLPSWCLVHHFSSRSTHMHCISHLAYHDMYCIMLLVHCTMIYCGSFACVLALGRAGRRVREWGTCWEHLWGSSFCQLWELCRQDDHTFDITSIFALLVARSIVMLALPTTCLSCLPYCHVKPLTILS